ncbi:MAG: enoyl-CoA hydratase, partial [Brevibacterium sp.]|nr:enoyl-CoA hydratase [Brevibacterium sp.]
MINSPVSHLADVSSQPTTREISETLRFTTDSSIGILTLDRPSKRNALDDATVAALGEFFRTPPEVSAIVLTTVGDHFCA